jgi:hypothetical protein
MRRVPLQLRPLRLHLLTCCLDSLLHVPLLHQHQLGVDTHWLL